MAASQLPDPLPYIDAHCHLADPRLDGIREAVLERSRKAGIGRWIQGGVDPDDWDRQLLLREQTGGAVIPSFGLHPWWVAARAEAEVRKGLEALEKRAGEVGALGEMGLDHGKRCPPDSHALQLQAFEAQLRLAIRLDLPVILHIVRAHDVAIDVLRRIGVPRRGGIVHSFSGAAQAARAYQELGLAISVCGAITRKGFESLKRAVVSVPLDFLVLETDSPDQPPAGRERELPSGSPHGLNEPATLLQVADAVASLRSGRGRNESAEQLLARSTENVIRIFGL